MGATAAAIICSGVGGGGALIPGAPLRLLPVKRSVSLRRSGVSNGSRTHCMQVLRSDPPLSSSSLSPPLISSDFSVSSQTWSPLNNKKFETLSYLPPLSDESIAKEIEYMISKGWIPCLEFDEVT